MIDHAIDISVALSLIAAAVSIVATFIALRAQRTANLGLHSKEGPIDSSPNTEEKPVTGVVEDDGDDHD